MSALDELSGDPILDAAYAHHRWAITRPSELRNKAALRWPHDVATLTGLPVSTLQEHASRGDAPAIYALGKARFTTLRDVEQWITGRPVITRGAK